MCFTFIYLSFLAWKTELATDCVFALVAEHCVLQAMASSDATSRTFWNDSEIVVDKDGIPHFTGEQPALMKEYRRRVIFAFNSLEGDGDTEAKEKADLVKKRKRFASRLVNGLHGEAWKAVENLLADTETLRKEDGYKAIFACLQKIEKEGVIRKTEAFDNFFEGAGRKASESMDHYLRRKQQAWDDLKDLDDQTSMSDDLLTYFLLKGSGLSREDRRGILLANKNTYDKKGVEQALRVSYHDLHERERRNWKSDQPRRGFQSSRPAFRKSYATVDEEVASSFDFDDGAYHLSYDDSEHYIDEYDTELAEGENFEDAFAGGDGESEEGFSGMVLRKILKCSKPMPSWTNSAKATRKLGRRCVKCRRVVVSFVLDSPKSGRRPLSERKQPLVVRLVGNWGIGQAMQHARRAQLQAQSLVHRRVAKVRAVESPTNLVRLTLSVLSLSSFSLDLMMKMMRLSATWQDQRMRWSKMLGLRSWISVGRRWHLTHKDQSRSGIGWAWDTPRRQLHLYQSHLATSRFQKSRIPQRWAVSCRRLRVSSARHFMQRLRFVKFAAKEFEGNEGLWVAGRVWPLGSSNQRIQEWASSEVAGIVFRCWSPKETLFSPILEAGGGEPGLWSRATFVSPTRWSIIFQQCPDRSTGSSFLAGSWASGVTGHGGGESIQGIGKAVGGDWC